MELNNMKLIELIRYFQKISYKEFLENIDDYHNLSQEKMNLLFLNANLEIQKYIIDDKSLFNKVVSIPNNKRNKMIMELINPEIKDYIMKSQNIMNSNSGKKMLINYFSKINYDEFSKLVNKYKFSFLENELNIEEFNPSDYLSKLIKTNKDYSSVYLFKIKNKYELFIYSKFNILVEIKKNKSNDIYLDDEIDLASVVYYTRAVLREQLQKCGNEMADNIAYQHKKKILI